jgi:hypothetical protein
MLRTSCLVASLLLLTAAVGCDDDEPTTPTGFNVILYQNTNYSGDSRVLIGNAADLDDYPGCGGASDDWNDCISSCDRRVVARLRAGQLRRPEHDTDRRRAGSRRIAGPCGNDWDDCISSIQVRQPPSWEPIGDKLQVVVGSRDIGRSRS